MDFAELGLPGDEGEEGSAADEFGVEVLMQDIAAEEIAQQRQQTVQRQGAGPTRPAPPTQEDQVLSEVEERLEVAEYYKVLLRAELFTDASNPAIAAKVQNQFRQWCRGQLEGLFNLGQKAPVAPPAAAQFDQTEVVVLKTLAKAFLSRPKLLQSFAGPAQVQSVAAPKKTTTAGQVQAPPNARRKLPMTPTPVQPARQEAPAGPPPQEGDENLKSTRSAPMRAPRSRGVPKTREEMEAASAAHAAAAVRVGTQVLHEKTKG